MRVPVVAAGTTTEQQEHEQDPAEAALGNVPCDRGRGPRNSLGGGTGGKLARAFGDILVVDLELHRGWLERRSFDVKRPWWHRRLGHGVRVEVDELELLGHQAIGIEIRAL